MSNATETTVPKAEKKKPGCCGDGKDGKQPAAPTVATDEATPAGHTAHDHSKHASGTGCCGGEKTRK